MNELQITYDDCDVEIANIVVNMCKNTFSHKQITFGQNVKKMLAFIISSTTVSPDDIVQKGGKYLILGKLSDDWLAYFDLREKNMPRFSPMSSSIDYHDSLMKIDGLIHRPLTRYDYTDEWNNHGYGKIGVSNSIFDIAMGTYQSPYEIAAVVNEKNEHITSYMCRKDTGNASYLWINRPVGPVDSLEWSIVEEFFANYRSDELPCVPYIREVPAEYNGVMTMRLDCDQDIASARDLFEMYSDEDIPMSLAIVTGNDIRKSDRELINDVIRNGGAILSHSMNHFPNWGGNPYGAYMEALGSRFWLERNIGTHFSAHPYAVSPFHQNPDFAVSALEKAGYVGFVAGSIHNDPEYMLARGGHVPGHEHILSISNQCMLHGDCYHAYGNNIKPYKECFDMYYQAKGIFGYLDHPFSETYHYGWNSEEERINVHHQLIHYAKKHSDMWFCNLQEALEFTKEKTQVQLHVTSDDQVIDVGAKNKHFHFTAVYKNKPFNL